MPTDRRTLTPLDQPPLPDVLRDLASAASAFARAATAENTKRVYRTAWAHFAGWCAARGLDPLPAEPATVGLFLADHAAALSVATLELRLAAIRRAHRMAGHRLDGAHPAIRDVFAGIRRRRGTAPRKKDAAVTEIVRDAVRALPPGPIGVRDKALLLVGFAAALRRSELVALDRQDIAFTAEGLVLTVRRRKTDQDGAGTVIGVPHGRSEVTCPVRALQGWLERVGNDAEAPLFRPVNKAGRVGRGRLSDRTVARVVKRAVGGAGYDPQAFAGHSLRAGFATSAARARVPEREIMAQTGHRSATMVREYIRAGSIFLDNAAAKVGL